MTGQLADIAIRIEGIRQLGAIVGAMTGIAAARARVAHDQIGAAESYTTTIAQAMARVIGPDVAIPPPAPCRAPALLVFCAEQGFAGAFSERVLDAIPDIAEVEVFLVGSRGVLAAQTRGIAPIWTAAMPSHAPGIPKFADRTVQILQAHLADGKTDQLDVVYPDWITGRVSIRRRRLYPMDLSALVTTPGPMPLVNLPPLALLAALGADYLHAQICKAALHAFAAENEARMAAMATAQVQIDRELLIHEGLLRRLRQEEITAEIIDLATGERASRGHG